jgi:hypothetical protein
VWQSGLLSGLDLGLLGKHVHRRAVGKDRENVLKRCVWCC